MPNENKKPNKNNSHKEISKAVLSVEDLPIETIGLRKRVSHSAFAATFDISPQLVHGELMSWLELPGHRSTVWHDADGVTLWADATAVLVLVDTFRCQQSAAEHLLTRLGFYGEPKLGVAV